MCSSSGGLLGMIAGAVLGFATGGATFGLAGALRGGLGGALAGGSIGGSIGNALFGGKAAKEADSKQQVASAPAVPESQAAKSPTAASVQAGMLGMGQSGGAPGIAQTFLTGAGGVDPNTLSLGKNTLLGQ